MKLRARGTRCVSRKNQPAAASNLQLLIDDQAVGTQLTGKAYRRAKNGRKCRFAASGQDFAAALPAAAQNDKTHRLRFEDLNYRGARRNEIVINRQRRGHFRQQRVQAVGRPTNFKLTRKHAVAPLLKERLNCLYDRSNSGECRRSKPRRQPERAGAKDQLSCFDFQNVRSRPRLFFSVADRSDWALHALSPSLAKPWSARVS